MPSRVGCALFAAPPVAIAVVIALYAWLLMHGLAGRPAEGRVETMNFRACAEARPVVEARARAMGLDPVLESVEGGFRLTATLPAEEDVAAAIPGTLADPGRFSLRAEDGTVLVDNAGVAAAGVRMDLLMRPATWVRFAPEARDRVHAHVRAHPTGTLLVVVDEVEVWRHANEKEPGAWEIEIPPSAENDRARMHLAARRGIVLDAPLPCEVALGSAAP